MTTIRVIDLDRVSLSRVEEEVWLGRHGTDPADGPRDDPTRAELAAMEREARRAA